MADEIKWLIGLGMTLVLAASATIIGAFRGTSAKITAVHNRIDKVKDDYVRREDLDGHIQRIEGNLRELRDEIRANHAQLLSAMTKGRDHE